MRIGHNGKPGSRATRPDPLPIPEGVIPARTGPMNRPTPIVSGRARPRLASAPVPIPPVPIPPVPSPPLPARPRPVLTGPPSVGLVLLTRLVLIGLVPMRPLSVGLVLVRLVPIELVLTRPLPVEPVLMRPLPTRATPIRAAQT